MIKIAPSILASDFTKLGDEVIKVDKAGADYIHIDVMDGHFVPNITIGPPVVKAIRKITNKTLDVHLMISNPDLYIEQFANAGADIICVHQEACTHLDRTIQLIKSFGKKAAVALNPATPIDTLKTILHKVDMVLLMTVNPGFGGQSYIDYSTDKIKELRKLIISKNLTIDVEVDGGITLDNIGMVTKAGANVIVAGSTIYKAKDTIGIIKQLRERAY
ncbi:MAG: ribulose-phosphate 3-epimerase [Clostridiales bacterium]|nr:ribulose-phosphate 3-epimerase [Clostridiales bacterium]